MPHSLRFAGVSASYGDVAALADVTIEFEPGFNVVLGPNGAGKTTLFRIGAGVLPPDAGSVSIDGKDPFVEPGIKRAIGYLPHGTPLDARLTVREHLEYWGRVHGFDAPARERHSRRVVESMDLEALLDRSGTDLSRGQRQRVTIARCLLSDPAVLFLDEPTTGLDPTAAATLRNRLAALADTGRIICYSTHNLDEAERLADDLTVVRNGQIVAKGPEADLTARIHHLGVGVVRITCDATEADFAALGMDAAHDGNDWHVELPGDRRVADLVRGLVERDVAIEAVYPAETSLEDLYRELAAGGTE